MGKEQKEKYKNYILSCIKLILSSYNYINSSKGINNTKEYHSYPYDIDNKIGSPVSDILFCPTKISSPRFDYSSVSDYEITSYSKKYSIEYFNNNHVFLIRY